MPEEPSEPGPIFDRLMAHKFEFWQVGLFVLMLLLGVVGFGHLVLHQASGERNYGTVGDAAIAVASLPRNTKQVFKTLIDGGGVELAVSENRFEDEAGFVFSYDANTHPSSGYLLLSRYDGDAHRSIVELIDLNQQRTLHTWAPDFAEINRHSKLKSALTDLDRDNSPERARMMHPYATSDGGLVFENMSPLVKIDVCSNIVWMSERLYHHSIESDGENGFWAMAFREPQTLCGVSDHFKEDALMHVSRDGKIIFEKSLAQILLENNLERLVFGLDFYSDDPLHLNDIQPINANGRFWRRGDLLLSARNISTIFIYRPSTNKIVWFKQGPWTNQHDVDVIGPSTIATFDNNRMNRRGRSYVAGVNNVLVYDLAARTVSRPFHEGFESHDVRTISEGRSEIVGDDDVIVEESNYGRLLRFDRDGEVEWSFVNRASDGKVYVVSWSRYLSPSQGAALAKTVSGSECAPAD